MTRVQFPALAWLLTTSAPVPETLYTLLLVSGTRKACDVGIHADQTLIHIKWIKKCKKQRKKTRHLTMGNGLRIHTWEGQALAGNPVSDQHQWSSSAENKEPQSAYPRRKSSLGRGRQCCAHASHTKFTESGRSPVAFYCGGWGNTLAVSVKEWRSSHRVDSGGLSLV